MLSSGALSSLGSSLSRSRFLSRRYASHICA